MRAIRLASATTAIILPRRAAIRSAQSLSTSVRGLRNRRIESATCTSKYRRRPLPALVMRPLCCFSPELISLGLSPRYASTLVHPAESLRLVDGRGKRRRRYRPDATCAADPPDRLSALCPRLKPA